ncbi:unnamed protein product [Mytilus coruscus]|uniref:Uncharacterized protein n=1 Tax=Mytilus coruscus TaxID=42192 RepID=A0A6J8F243_MYTCO|nr:unnamed protein product [Mytilus coruscus]
MRPSSQVEVKSWLCLMTFRTRRQLKNHLAAAPHKRLSVICVWCPKKKTYRRMVDLKEHVMANHRSKIELMPYSFLSENNGFWMSNYPETYAKFQGPSSKRPQNANALIRRMTALVNIKYTGLHTFSVPIDGELKSIMMLVVARKLSISDEYIADIKTSDELFPGKHTKASTNPLSPLKTPSTSDIILEDDRENEEPEILNEKATSQKKSKTENEEAKKIKQGKDDKKQDQEIRLKEEEQKRREEQKQDEEIRLRRKNKRERKNRNRTRKSD